MELRSWQLLSKGPLGHTGLGKKPWMPSRIDLLSGPLRLRSLPTCFAPVPAPREARPGVQGAWTPPHPGKGTFAKRSDFLMFYTRWARWSV